MNSIKRTALFTAVCAAVASPQLFAQSSGGFMLEEVIVTATKRDSTI